MPGQDSHGHVVKKSHIGRGQFKGNRIIVQYRNLLHILVIGSVLRAVVRIHNGFYGKFHIISGKCLPVVPFYPFSEMKGIGVRIFVKFPAFRQTGNYLIVSVVSRQSAKKQDIYLAVFVHGRINAGIIAASVNQRHRFGA